MEHKPLPCRRAVEIRHGVAVEMIQICVHESFLLLKSTDGRCTRNRLRIVVNDGWFLDGVEARKLPCRGHAISLCAHIININIEGCKLFVFSKSQELCYTSEQLLWSVKKASLNNDWLSKFFGPMPHAHLTNIVHIYHTFIAHQLLRETTL